MYFHYRQKSTKEPAVGRGSRPAVRAARAGRTRGGGRGFGRPGGWQQADLPSAEDAAAWFTGRLPSDWFVGAPDGQRRSRRDHRDR